MIKKITKWTLIIVGSLIAFAIIFYSFVYFKTNSRINTEYQVRLQTLNIPTDSAAYERGERIAMNRGCMGCHGNDLSGGMAFADEKSPIGSLYASNITSGKGGIKYQDADWIRVLRHGLAQNNKSVWFMPSQDIYKISNRDLADLISYLKKQPPVDKKVSPHSLKPLGRMLVFTNKFPLLVAEMIDQQAVFPDSVQASVSVSYGAYLATTCQGCHGGNFKGGPGHGPGDPAIPDITSASEVG